MNYQPLVSDLDGDGHNEIILFSDTYLKIYDAHLQLKDELSIGTLQSQFDIYQMDADQYPEIIFHTNKSGTLYFTIASYTGTGFIIKTKIPVPTSGALRCTDWNGAPACLYQDTNGSIHGYLPNATKYTDDIIALQLFSGQDYRPSLFSPPVADINLDGKKDACFLQYRSIVCVSENNRISFNASIEMTTYTNSPGGILITQLDDGPLELIITINRVYFSSGKYRSFLKVFNANSTLKFQKDYRQEINDYVYTAGQPVAFDADNNDAMDVCALITYNTNTIGSGNKRICYNAKGEQILEINTTQDFDFYNNKIADMNRDGYKDFVMRNGVYDYKNNRTIKNLSLSGSGEFIVADIDGNGKLDILQTVVTPIFQSPKIVHLYRTNLYLDSSGSLVPRNTTILPKIPSDNEPIQCSWQVQGNGRIYANVSWYKNGKIFRTQKNILCSGNSRCTSENIPSYDTISGDLFRCEVVVFNSSYSSINDADETFIIDNKNEWKTFCNGNHAPCTQSGASLFSEPQTRITKIERGMDFEPLISDINADTRHEIIVFPSGYLEIYNESLGRVAQSYVGNVLGQPALFGDTIYFTAIQNASFYFMGYTYTSSLRQLCNTTLPHDVSSAGVACIALNNTPYCFFKDDTNVFYKLKTDCTIAKTYATNYSIDKTKTIPVIRDYDYDGKTEAMWWFNNDSDQYMGIIMLELDSMTPDTGFSDGGILDDITFGNFPYNYNTEGYEKLKAQPKFYDTDNDGKLEILISYDYERMDTGYPYDSSCFRGVLKLFDTDGALLWEKRPADCGNPANAFHFCGISTPVFIDADNDRYEDICFLAAGNYRCYSSMPFNHGGYMYCYNRFGEVLQGYPKSTNDTKMYASPTTDKYTPTYAADMDSDGTLEIIGGGYIWNLDGTVLKGNYSRYPAAIPVPVDVDSDGILELVGTQVAQTIVVNPSGELCNGTLSVFAYADDNTPFNARVYRENVLAGTTGSQDIFEKKYQTVCGKNVSVTARCVSSEKSCGTHSMSIDFNGDSDTLEFDCSVCDSKSDIWIVQKEINYDTVKNTITVPVNARNALASGVNLTVQIVNPTKGVITTLASTVFDILDDAPGNKIINIQLSDGEIAHVYLHAPPEISEPKENNYAAIPIVKNKIPVYLNISTGNPYLDSALYEYVRQFVIPSSDADSFVTVAIGLGEQNSLINAKRDMTKRRFGLWSDMRGVYVDNALIGTKPYTGVVGSFKETVSSDFTVFVMASDIEGVVAAAKRLGNARNLFLSGKQMPATVVVGDADILGISVFDRLHTPENEREFGKRTPEFGAKVERILFDNDFETAIKTVRTINDNTTLRLKHMRSDFSEGFRKVVVLTNTPVVMSGGIYSNLYTFEDGLGKDLVKDGHDVWLIEMTGGPYTECATCPDYSYEDLTEFYWPALVGGVMFYSGENQINYVGHSNGCRVGLSYLNSYTDGKTEAGYVFDSQTGLYDTLVDVPPQPVDKFFGVACPVTLAGNSYTKRNIVELKNGNYAGRLAIRKLNQSTNKHISQREFVKTLNGLGSTFRLRFDNSNKISLNLQKFYVNKYIEENSTSQFNLNLNSVFLYAGDKPSIPLLTTNNDDAVPLSDVYILNSSIISFNKQVNVFHDNHEDLKSNNLLRKNIREALK